MLQFIKNKNIERKKNNINEMPILFVKNGQDLKDNYVPKFFEYLKNFLKKNNLIELYDNTVNVKHNNNVEDEEDDNFFEENENLGDKYENYVDGNLIQVHIPTGKNINKLFSTINEYNLKYNKLIFDDKDIEIKCFEMKNKTKNLINYYILEKIQNKSLSSSERKELNLIYDECNEFVKKIKNSCSLLYDLNILDIKTKVKKYLILGLLDFLSFFLYFLMMLVYFLTHNSKNL